MILATGTDWVGILTALGVLLPVIVTGIVKIVAAINAAHTTAQKAAVAAQIAAETAAKAAALAEKIHKDIQLPSNGTTLGAGIEGIGQKQDLAIGLSHPEVNTPSFVQIARDLTSDPPMRRTDDPPTPAPTPPPITTPEGQ